MAGAMYMHKIIICGNNFEYEALIITRPYSNNSYAMSIEIVVKGGNWYSEMGEK